MTIEFDDFDKERPDLNLDNHVSFHPSVNNLASINVMQLESGGEAETIFSKRLQPNKES